MATARRPRVTRTLIADSSLRDTPAEEEDQKWSTEASRESHPSFPPSPFEAHSLIRSAGDCRRTSSISGRARRRQGQRNDLAARAPLHALVRRPVTDAYDA